MKKLLITGFDAFNLDSHNPSSLAIMQLKDQIGGIKVIKKVLPTKFKVANKMLDKYLKEYNPDYVICVGQAAGRSKISLERVGLNLMDATIFDNAKYMPKDIIIHKDGDLAYLSNLPLKEYLYALKDKGISSEISYSAGTFVCNSVLYHLLYLINKKQAKIQAGFIHIPLIKIQTSETNKHLPTMDLEKIVKALNIVIKNL